MSKLLIFLVLLLPFLLLLISHASSVYASPLTDEEKKKAVEFCFETGKTPPPFLQVSNFAPGSEAEGTLKFANCGNKKARHFGLLLSYEFFDPRGDSTAESFLSNLTLLELKVGKENDLLYRNLLSEVTDVNGNGVKDLYDLSVSSISISYVVNSCNERSCEYHYLHVEVKFNESAGNQFQGDRVNLTFTLTLG